MAAPAAPAQTGQPAAQKTVKPIGSSYLILEATAEDKTFRVAGTVHPRDNEHAIRKHSEQNNNKAGIYVAISAAKWKPISVTPETVTTLKLEDAK